MVLNYILVGYPWELSRNQPRLRFEVILQHDSVTIGQSNNAFSILEFSLAGKRRVHWLIKQITNTYRNHFTETIFHTKIALAVQSSVWTERKYWTVPCEQSFRSSFQPVEIRPVPCECSLRAKAALYILAILQVDMIFTNLTVCT